MVYPLLQAGNLPQGRILVLCLVMVVGIIIAMAFVLAFKRWLQKDEASASAGFTLSDLRQLHKNGQMTDAEFEKAKAQIVDAARRASERQKNAVAAAPDERRGNRPDPME